MDANVGEPIRRRMSDASSMESENEDAFGPPDVENSAGYRSPPHSTGHLTPGHVVGRPLHDSPKHEHHIPLPSAPATSFQDDTVAMKVGSILDALNCTSLTVRPPAISALPWQLYPLIDPRSQA